MNYNFVENFTMFREMEDPRINRTKRHDLFEMIVVALCATVAGANCWCDVARFANKRLDWLRSFLTLQNGAPSHDTFSNVFNRINSAEMTKRIGIWVSQISSDVGKHVAIDGKTLKGSFDRANEQNPLHLVSAWASDVRLVLAQVAVADKSNEITAIPLLLDLLDIKGATVTIDAMGCQKQIAKEIIDKDANYILALKSNHPKLYEAVENEFELAATNDYADRNVSRLVTVDKGHGREERREYVIMPAPTTLPGYNDWASLCSIAMVIRITQENGKETTGIRYYLTSLPAKVKAFSRFVRQHWSIENSVHWVLDVNFTEDDSRIRKGMGPQITAMFRRMAVSILSRDTSLNDSIRGKRYTAALSIDALEKILLSAFRN